LQRHGHGSTIDILGFTSPAIHEGEGHVTVLMVGDPF
jgi:hypothetical protein